MPSHPAFLPRVLRLQIRDRNLCCRDAIGARAFRQPGSVEAYLRFFAFRRLKFSARDIRSRRRGYDNSRAIESTLQLFERRLEELEALLCKSRSGGL